MNKNHTSDWYRYSIINIWFFFCFYFSGKKRSHHCEILLYLVSNSSNSAIFFDYSPISRSVDVRKCIFVRYLFLFPNFYSHSCAQLLALCHTSAILYAVKCLLFFYVMQYFITKWIHWLYFACVILNHFNFTFFTYNLQKEVQT